jgi:sugar phosphate isomerase/epimerase
MADIPVALQMYTVRDACEKDFAATLARVAEIGYAGVELAGTYGLTPDKMAGLLGELNLRAVGNHTALAAIRDNFEEVVALHQAVGAEWVIVPSLPKEMRESADALAAAGKALGESADRLADAGLKLAYHNHAFEFETYDGKVGYDILLQSASAKVFMELDVYWVRHAGGDPADLIRRLGPRCPLVHLKDMTPGDEPTFAEVGHGVIDFDPIFAAAAEAAARWYIVEQDRCVGRASLESAELSFQSLRRWGKA